MAFFDFLQNTAAPVIGQLGGAATSALNIYDLFNRDRDVYEEIPSLQQMLNASEASRVYAQAAGDPTSPYYKNIAGTYDEENRRNVVAAIRQIQRENARAYARGDPAFGVSPERRDESRAKAVAQLFQLSKERSRDETRNTLLGASGASARAAGSYVPSLSVFGRYGDLNETMRGSGREALARAFESLTGLGGQGGGGGGGGPGPTGSGFTSSIGRIGTVPIEPARVPSRYPQVTDYDRRYGGASQWFGAR